MTTPTSRDRLPPNIADISRLPRRLDGLPHAIDAIEMREFIIDRRKLGPVRVIERPTEYIERYNRMVGAALANDGIANIPADAAAREAYKRASSAQDSQGGGKRTEFCV